MAHDQEVEGQVQVAASDETNQMRFVGADDLKRALGITDLEERVAKLEGAGSRKQPKQQDRMSRGKEDRKQ